MGPLFEIFEKLDGTFIFCLNSLTFDGTGDGPGKVF